MHTGVKFSYQCLAQQIRETIEQGHFSPGAYFNSEWELTRSSGFSRVTVRRAADLLIKEKVIERRPGRGLFVYDGTDQRQRRICIMVDNLAREPCVRLARGVQKWDQQYNYHFDLVDGHAERVHNLAMLDQLVRSENVDGAVIMSWHTSEFFEALCRLKSRNLPFVVVDHHCSQLAFPCVVADNYQGGRLVADYLHGIGHRAFAFVGDISALTVQKRLNGYRDRLCELGVLLPPACVLELTPDDRFTDWAKLLDTSLSKIFTQTPRPTALFVSCDYLALGVYRWCSAHGLSIPGDVSVVGFDNEPCCEWLSPALTTVAQPFTEMGDRAVQLLNKLIAGRPWDGNEITLPVQLVTRGSTAAPHHDRA